MAARSSPYDRYRKQAWDNVAARSSDRVDLELVREELKTLVPRTVRDQYRDQIEDAACWVAVKNEDERRTTPSHQAALPGWPDAEDDFWVVGEGERVRVGAASADDHLRHVQLIDENASRITAAAVADRERYYRLAPYYLQGARTVADAAAQWQRDHP